MARGETVCVPAWAPAGLESHPLETFQETPLGLLKSPSTPSQLGAAVCRANSVGLMDQCIDFIFFFSEKQQQKIIHKTPFPTPY